MVIAHLWVWLSRTSWSSAGPQSGWGYSSSGWCSPTWWIPWERHSYLAGPKQRKGVMFIGYWWPNSK